LAAWEGRGGGPFCLGKGKRGKGIASAPGVGGGKKEKLPLSGIIREKKGSVCMIFYYRQKRKEVIFNGWGEGEGRKGGGKILSACIILTWK